MATKKTEKKIRKDAAEPDVEAVSTRALAFEKRVEQLERRMGNAEDVFSSQVERLDKLDDRLGTIGKTIRTTRDEVYAAIAELASKVATLAGEAPAKSKAAGVPAAAAPRASYREIANAKRAARNAPRPVRKAIPESDR